MSDEAGDGGVLTDGDIHGQVEQHRVIVVNVQHPDPHQHLRQVKGEEEVKEEEQERRGHGGDGGRERRKRKGRGTWWPGKQWRRGQVEQDSEVVVPKEGAVHLVMGKKGK